MRKNFLLISIVVVLVFLVIISSVFWYRFTDFYKSCAQIKIGMGINEVEGIMRPYMDNNKFSVSRDGALWGEGLYISSNASGNQCNISIKNGKVDKSEAKFE